MTPAFGRSGSGQDHASGADVILARLFSVSLSPLRGRFSGW